jgi:hypothetical protein
VKADKGANACLHLKNINNKPETELFMNKMPPPNLDAAIISAPDDSAIQPAEALPWWSAEIARTKWKHLQEGGAVLIGLQFLKNGHRGLIDAWGKVTWLD